MCPIQQSAALIAEQEGFLTSPALRRNSCGWHGMQWACWWCCWGMRRGQAKGVSETNLPQRATHTHMSSNTSTLMHSSRVSRPFVNPTPMTSPVWVQNPSGAMKCVHGLTATLLGQTTSCLDKLVEQAIRHKYFLNYLTYQYEIFKCELRHQQTNNHNIFCMQRY